VVTLLRGGRPTPPALVVFQFLVEPAPQAATPFLGSGHEPGLRGAAHDTLMALSTVDADAVWLLMADITLAASSCSGIMALVPASAAATSPRTATSSAAPSARPHAAATGGGGVLNPAAAVATSGGEVLGPDAGGGATAAQALDGWGDGALATSGTLPSGGGSRSIGGAAKSISTSSTPAAAFLRPLSVLLPPIHLLGGQGDTTGRSSCGKGFRGGGGSAALAPVPPVLLLSSASLPWPVTPAIVEACARGAAEVLRAMEGAQAARREGLMARAVPVAPQLED
jgi:hypothetical protein